MNVSIKFAKQLGTQPTPCPLFRRSFFCCLKKKTRKEEGNFPVKKKNRKRMKEETRKGGREENFVCIMTTVKLRVTMHDVASSQPSDHSSIQNSIKFPHLPFFSVLLFHSFASHSESCAVSLSHSPGTSCRFCFPVVASIRLVVQHVHVHVRFVCVAVR